MHGSDEGPVRDVGLGSEVLGVYVSLVGRHYGSLARMDCRMATSRSCTAEMNGVSTLFNSIPTCQSAPSLLLPEGVPGPSD